MVIRTLAGRFGQSSCVRGRLIFSARCVLGISRQIKEDFEDSLYEGMVNRVSLVGSFSADELAMSLLM